MFGSVLILTELSRRSIIIKDEVLLPGISHVSCIENDTHHASLT